jgi:hypothetical protein
MHPSLAATIDAAAAAAVVAIFGTYSAQIAAGGRLGLHTAAQPCLIKDRESQTFLQVTVPYLHLR